MLGKTACCSSEIFDSIFYYRDRLNYGAASCLDRQQGELCSLPRPSELLVLIVNYHLQREWKKVNLCPEIKSVLSTKSINLTKKKRHFLHTFTSWLVFIILGIVNFFFFASIYLYTSLNLHCHPDLSPFLWVHFHCTLQNSHLGIPSLVLLSPFLACAHVFAVLLITSYLEAV